MRGRASSARIRDSTRRMQALHSVLCKYYEKVQSSEMECGMYRALSSFIIPADYLLAAERPLASTSGTLTV
jgi:hypothetical protein